MSNGMPELPEVQTTAQGLDRALPGASIHDVWTDWPRTFRGGFESFRKAVIGKKVRTVSRRGKNVLIHLSEDITIIVHMKMTGHLLYGKYEKRDEVWRPTDKKSPLADPYNRFIHALFALSDGKHLAFSDSRKFGRIAHELTSALAHSPQLAHLGPEPLEKNFGTAAFEKALMRRPRARVKQALMDQRLIAGIGNIYSDEMLWRAGIHPEARVASIPPARMKRLFRAMKDVLRQGIDLGGDSTSDYRNIEGARGAFQGRHRAYRRTGETCGQKGCRGVILRKLVGGRSAHYCSVHQKK